VSSISLFNVSRDTSDSQYHQELNLVSESILNIIKNYSTGYIGSKEVQTVRQLIRFVVLSDTFYTFKDLYDSFFDSHKKFIIQFNSVVKFKYTKTNIFFV